MGMLLTVIQGVFIGLKLAGLLAWSWLWVLMPTLLPILVFCLLVVAVLLLAVTSECLAHIKDKLSGCK